jgi:prevent-host-death family protein
MARIQITNISQAKATLSRLVARAMRGEQVIIAKAGRPVARLVPFDYETSPRDLEQGIWQGKVWMAEDFDELPEELRKAFAGEAEDERG